MKNVLIIANSGMNNSGVPNVICQVINSQYQKHHIVLVVFNDDDYYYPFLEERKVKIIKVNLNIPQSSLKKLIWHFYEYPRIFRKIISNIINNNEINIIHSFKEEEGWPALKAAKNCGIANRITHCNNEFRKRNGLLPQLIAKRNRRKLLKYSTTNIGVCEKCCLSLYKNKPYTIIYNSYNESVFNSFVKCKLDNEIALTHIATFSSRKNQLFSIGVLEMLAKQGIKCKLNLVGFPIDESYFNEMINIIKEKRLNDYVSVIDGKNGIGDIFEKTTFLLLPSLSEAAPIVLVEAQACGIRCFASDVITKEINCGGVTFLPINKGYEIWANTINESFKSNRNYRSIFDMNRFSSNTFARFIDKIYEL